MRSFHSGPSIAVTLGICSALVSCDDDPAAPGDGDGGSTPIVLATFQEASVAAGQPNRASGAENAGGTTGPSGFSIPLGIGGAVYVADAGNNRVLGFDGIPSFDGEAASVVLGQPDFTSSGAGLSAQSFRNPRDCAVVDGRLFVADAFNHRVLIWNSLPTSNVPADVVVGQPDFTSDGSATGQSRFDTPVRVAVARNKLFVADFGNSRISIWNTVPTTNDEPADVVVGQTDFTSSTVGLTASSFGYPRGLWTDGRRLVIAESEHNRVLIWNSIPTTNGRPADVVVGAADFTTASSTIPSATSIGDPWAVTSDGRSLFVADSGFNRVLVYTPFPRTNGAAASVVLGQNSFANSTRNDADQDGVIDGPTGRTLSSPSGIHAVGRQLLVADLQNHRVLVFDGN